MNKGVRASAKNVVAPPYSRMQQAAVSLAGETGETCLLQGSMLGSSARLRGLGGSYGNPTP